MRINNCVLCTLAAHVRATVWQPEAQFLIAHFMSAVNLDELVGLVN